VQIGVFDQQDAAGGIDRHAAHAEGHAAADPRPGEEQRAGEGLDPSVKDWWPVAMMNVNASVAWGLRVVTTLQSLASGVLIFLLAVGVRRRFQIG